MIRTLETFDARIYTSTFRAYGTIHLPPEQTTEALLNAMARQLLPVTDPLIYAPGTDHPPSQGDLKVSAGFLAVHHDQIDWIVGGRPPNGNRAAAHGLSLRWACPGRPAVRSESVPVFGFSGDGGDLSDAVRGRTLPLAGAARPLPVARARHQLLCSRWVRSRSRTIRS